MKTLKKSLVATFLTLCLLLSLVACEIPLLNSSSSSSDGDSGITGAYAYIAIDINPSIELVVVDGKVESVRACNDDATILLTGEDLVGLTTEEATEKIVALAEELGYINDDNTDVKITVTSENEEDATEIEADAKDGVKKGSSRAIVNSNPRLADEREVKELKDENPELYKNFSPAKLRLIKSIMEYDSEMSVEIGVEMSVEELIQLLKEYTNEFSGFVGKELHNKVKERKEEIKAQKEKQIAEIYGENHLEIWNKLYSLKELYKELKEKANSVELSEEDINALLEIVGEENKDALEIDGAITLESVENFFDSHFSKELFESKEDIKAILDKYSHKNYVLTEDDLSRLKEIAGEVDATILSDIKAIIASVTEELKAEKENIKLNDEQKDRIDGLKENLESAKDELKEEFKAEIDKAIEHFEQEKEHRHEMHGHNR